MPGESPPVVGSSHIFHEAPFFSPSISPADSASKSASRLAGAVLDAPAPYPSAAWSPALNTVGDSDRPIQVASDGAPDEQEAGRAEAAGESPPETATQGASEAPAANEAPQGSDGGSEAGEETPPWSNFQFDSGAASTESEEEEPEVDETGELPPPESRTAGVPFIASELALIVAVAAGIGMIIAQRMLFLPLLYSIAFGMLLGWALARVPTRGGTNRVLLVALTLAAVLLAQGTFYLGNFLWDNHASQVKRLALREFVDMLTVDDAERLGRYLKAEAARKRVFGFPLGEYGSYVLASCEAFLMFMFAWLPVRSARRLKVAGSVPVEVLERVIELRRRKLEQPEVFLKLSEQGWINPADQRRAWEAASAYMALVSQRRRRR